MADFSLSTSTNGAIVIIKTSGYLNNIGGEKIADACYEEIKNGKSLFLLDLEDSKVVNSIGVSILIEIIEKLQEVDGKLGYFNLAPIVEKTFTIMGLTRYSTVFPNESEAIEGMS
tara:strand:+ start:2515 stop:2859 length:345 start_codon:yes stop_codon:yes gene_type:complete